VEERVEVASGPLPLPAYLAAPDGWPPGPAVVVVQEWWGLDAHIEDVTRRLAREGFAALAPDLYRGRQPREPDEARKLRMALEEEAVLRDLSASVTWLFDRGATSVGAIGFCMGGGLTWSLALTDDRLGAAVPFYGHVDLRGRAPKAPVLAHYAEHDRFPEEMYEQVRARIGDERFHRYPGTHHAFFNDARRSYDAQAASLAWERTIAFLRERLA
jgi:carboxymethylenebutenolidase